MESNPSVNDKEFNVSSILLKSHVTSVKFCFQYIFVGEGNRIFWFDSKTLAFLGEDVVFKACSVHGIRNASQRVGNDIKLLIFGGKSLRFYTVVVQDDIQRIIQLTEEQNMEDWICDVRWIISELLDSYKFVAVAQAHNSILLWNWREGKAHQIVQCQDRCILYTATLIGNTWSNIVLAAGTVFKNIILWSPVGKDDEDSNKIPLHCLSGHEKMNLKNIDGAFSTEFIFTSKEDRVPIHLLNKIAGTLSSLEVNANSVTECTIDILQGVIFSVSFNASLKVLCSTSDDRSMRLWKYSFMPMAEAMISSESMPLECWEQGTFHLIHILYAHESRVWMSVVLNSCIISIGEDSNICFWDHFGNLIKKEKCHKGGSIWCLDVNDENSIAITGGSDSGVLLWPIEHILKNSTAQHTSLPALIENSIDFPRNVGLLSSKQKHLMLVVTDKGNLLSYDLNFKQWKLIWSDPSYSSYAILAVSPSSSYIAIGNIAGEISLFAYLEELGAGYQILHENKWKVHSGKVNNIHWVSKSMDFILSCGPQGNMILWHLEQRSKEYCLVQKVNLHLPKIKHHWSSVAVLLDSVNHLIVGDRSGNVLVYSSILSEVILAEKKNPSSCYHCIHGKNGVTDIQHDKRFVYTAGRDGRVLLYKISHSGISLQHSIKVPNYMEWIGKITLLNDDIIISGFHTTKFMAWSTKMECQIMEVSCGGGHRSWDFSINENYKGIFIAIKKNKFISAEEELNFTLKKSVLKAGISGREFCCATYLFCRNEEKGDSFVLACGGEDNTFRIIALQYMSKNLSQIISLFNLSGHISSIKSIASCMMIKKNSYLVISVGGRAQMMIWKVESSTDLTCEELSSDFLWSLDKPHLRHFELKTKTVLDSQTRYMDVAVWLSVHTESEEYVIATACSDAFLRMFTFRCKDRELIPYFTLPHGNHCIFQISHINLKYCDKEENCLITGASDGKIRIYKYPSKSSDICKCSDANREKLSQIVDENVQLDQSAMKPMIQLNFHKSGINAIDVKQISDNYWLISSGGDDNCLSVAVIYFSSQHFGTEMKMTTLVSGVAQFAHAAQITGVKILTNKILASVSIDQRLNIWMWEVDKNVINLQLLKSKISNIPDIANMEMWWNETMKHWVAVVCGEGLECFHLDPINICSKDEFLSKIKRINC